MAGKIEEAFDTLVALSHGEKRDGQAIAATIHPDPAATEAAARAAANAYAVVQLPRALRVKLRDLARGIPRHLDYDDRESYHDYSAARLARELRDAADAIDAARAERGQR